ncbi:MAG: hypothetical protein IIC75_01015 [Bacteroidetes bacterium]|nr:hypothetical protein [Bacteroidota bacterium]
MKQIIQYQKTGEIFVEDLPKPQLKAGGVLVQNKYSLISAGTERSSVKTAQASMIGKAKSRPDLVKQVMENVNREGLAATYEKVKNRLDNCKELSYSSAGEVIESNVDEFFNTLNIKTNYHSSHFLQKLIYASLKYRYLLKRSKYNI